MPRRSRLPVACRDSVIMAVLSGRLSAADAAGQHNVTEDDVKRDVQRFVAPGRRALRQTN